MVERYSAEDIMWSIDNVEMSPTEDGEFVRYSDYAALEAQLANVKERANDAASMCEAGYPVSAFNLATSILSALEATPPAPKVTEAMVTALIENLEGVAILSRNEARQALTAAQESGKP